MLRLVSDENFNGTIVRGLLRRQAELDLVHVQDIGLSETPDPEILEWAAGKPMPGVFIVSDRMPIGQAIDEILFLSIDASPDEWKNQVLYLPL